MAEYGFDQGGLPLLPTAISLMHAPLVVSRLLSSMLIPHAQPPLMFRQANDRARRGLAFNLVMLSTGCAPQLTCRQAWIVPKVQAATAARSIPDSRHRVGHLRGLPVPTFPCPPIAALVEVTNAGFLSGRQLCDNPNHWNLQRLG